jgi:hypothetical protein
VYCSAQLAGGSPAPAAGVEEPRQLGGKARFVRQSDERGHWLVTDFHDPVEIEPGRLFVIGRDPHTSLVVRAGDVSRQHAEIDWEGDPPRPILREVRSSAGTFLNDKKVERTEPQPLRSGDRIRLGASTELHYRHVTPRELERELEERGRRETRTYDSGRLRAALAADVGEAVPAPAPAAGAARPQPARALPPGAADVIEAVVAGSDPGSEAGSFAQMPPGALIKRLHDERSSGVLTFFVEGAAPGEVVLIEGRCKDALIGLYSGREAVEVLAGMDQGAYRFRRDDAERLRLAPPSAEVDERGLEREFTGEALLQDLVGQRASGVLTVWDGAVTGELALRGGICQATVFGARRGREALDAVRGLDAEAYRFRPDPPSGADLPATQKVRAADLPRPPAGKAPAGAPRTSTAGSGRVPVAGGPARPGPAPAGGAAGPPPPRPASGSGRVPGAGPPARPGPAGGRPAARPAPSESGRVPPLRPGPGRESTRAPASPPRTGAVRPPSGDTQRALPPVRPARDEGPSPPVR